MQCRGFKDIKYDNPVCHEGHEDTFTSAFLCILHFILYGAYRRPMNAIFMNHHNHDYNKQRWAAALPPWGSLQARYQSPEPPRSWDYSPKWGLLISFHMDVLIFGMHRSVLSSQVIWRISWRRSMPSWTQGLLVCWLTFISVMHSNYRLFLHS